MVVFLEEVVYFECLFNWSDLASGDEVGEVEETQFDQGVFFLFHINQTISGLLSFSSSFLFFSKSSSFSSPADGYLQATIMTIIA